MAAPREDLIKNAVQFLADPKTLASPLAQRIQFLEAKGLTPAEIDIAVKQAAVSQPQPSSYGPFYGPASYALAYNQQQQWDWRDYFITAVVSGTLAYGATALFKKYLLPHLQPPSSTAYEEDRDALTAQFDAAEARLKEIQAETAAIRAAIDDQKAQVDRTVEDVQAAVAEIRQSETKTRDEMREVRDEVENIKGMLPKMLEKNKESHAQSLQELQQDLKSLKALLLSRGPSVPGTPAPSFPPPTIRPTIPAWQLASSTNDSSSTLPENGKGKEVSDSSSSNNPAPSVSS